MSKNISATQRFSHTVENYVKYRPHYPQETIKILKEHCKLSTQSIVADIGSGTGIFSQLLLEQKCRVFSVEPNHNMRHAAEEYLAHYENFTSINGTSEDTTLSTNSIDIITAAQAFHWFDQAKAKTEFKRILKPSAYIVLLWNLRDNNDSDFMMAYEQLLQIYGIDYEKVCAEGVTDKTIEDFFSPQPVTIKVLPNKQILDWTGFSGRLQSTSYVPKAGDTQFNAMMQQAKSIFDQHSTDGKITFAYNTKIYIGRLA